jgi:predicted Holliday junction resolvase-like endonuclease
MKLRSDELPPIDCSIERVNEPRGGVFFVVVVFVIVVVVVPVTLFAHRTRIDTRQTDTQTDTQTDRQTKEKRRRRRKIGTHWPRKENERKTNLSQRDNVNREHRISVFRK